MASEEDNFDIDIYGDGGEDYGHEIAQDETKVEEISNPYAQPDPVEGTTNSSSNLPSSGPPENTEIKQENGHEGGDVAQKIASTDQSAPDPVQLPRQAPQTQGLKRKDGADDRYVDPGATTAIFVSELHWWVNDDDIRGWANQSQCEDELEEITFSEHKVNGKSKGQAYILLKSPQAATAAKQKIESFGEGQQYTKKFTVSYTNPYTNPFKTLPKDGPMRNNGPANNNRSASGAYGSAGTGGTQSMGYNNSSGYRGNRGGGYNNRGGMNSMSGFNRGGFQPPMTGGFQGSGMGGFQGAAMGGMQSYGGFQGRGAMAGAMRGGAIGMRGGRGGMNNGMMNMPMNGMGMGAMGAMGMNMPQMGVGMGMQGMPAFHHQSHVSPSVRYGSSATPAGRSTSSNPQIRQYSPSSSQGAYSPGTAAASAPETNSNPGAAWTTYTQYSPPPSISPSAHFPSQATTPGTSFPTLRPSKTLKREPSMTGNQAHFNPAFFPQGQSSGGTGDASWNPHGAKRTRQE